MSRLDNLPPDQRAALSLLLRQRKSYAEVAALLGIREGAVRERAHAALATLAGGALTGHEASELPGARREEIDDYLLGQQTDAAARSATRAYLDDSAVGRAWAGAIAAELEPLSAAPLPEIPVGAGQPAPDTRDADDQPPGTPERSAGAPGIRPPGSLPSSRLGGALLLAAILAAVTVAVILIAGGGSGSHTSSSVAAAPSAAKTSSSSAASTTPAGPSEDARLTLTSPNPASKAVGVVEILSEGSKHAFYIAADHLPPSTGFFYAIWLYNSPTSHEALSKSPPVGSDGRLEGGALLPANAGEYHTMLLTRETSERPAQPGPIVLTGPFSLGR
jgi:Sigma-70, region 4